MGLLSVGWHTWGMFGGVVGIQFPKPHTPRLQGIPPAGGRSVQ